MVLEALTGPPYELLESASHKLFTLKMVLLLALTYLKRIGDLQALLLSPSCLDFDPSLVKGLL